MKKSNIGKGIGARKNVQSSVKSNNKNTNVRKVRPKGYERQLAMYSSISRFQNRLNKASYFRNARNRFYQYIRALYNPEDCVEGKYVAKQFSPISIPTSTVAFREQMYFTPGDGKFDMIWVPNFFTTHYALDRHIALNPSSGSTEFYSHLYLNDTHDGGWKLHTSYAPSINLAKYRLVSAKLVVEYNGPKIQQGGSIYSCAIYDDLPVFIGIDSRGDEQPYFPAEAFTTDRGENELAGYTDIELVQNGLWNRYVNFSTTRGIHSVIAVPTDPTDNTFFPMCNYYAETPSTVRLQDPPNSITPSKYLLSAKSSDGGHLSYIIKGDNLKSDSNNPVGIMVNVYYNFEIIADQSTAPFLRGKKGTDPDVAAIYDFGKEMVSEMVKEATAKGMTPDFMKIATKVVGNKLGIDLTQFKAPLAYLNRNNPNFVTSSDL